jgi:alpha-methylacyl-CoA racemase
MPGPLSGIRIIEFAGIGPAPFAAMRLADHGTTLVRPLETNLPPLGLARPETPAPSPL